MNTDKLLGKIQFSLPVICGLTEWHRLMETQLLMALNFIKINRFVLKENESIDLAVYRPFLCHRFFNLIQCAESVGKKSEHNEIIATSFISV